MAVRDALLVLLTMGPAYGFQLHGGLEARTGGRRRVNVGQTYATLERLTKQGLVAPAGTTDDGLPLHGLTEAGRSAVRAWLGGADAAGTDPWDETVDRVLLAVSLPGVHADDVVEGEAERWRGRRDVANAQAESASHAAEDPHVAATSALASLASRAEALRAKAAVEWLDVARAASTASHLAFGPQSARPKRGRRPAVARDGSGDQPPSASS